MTTYPSIRFKRDPEKGIVTLAPSEWKPTDEEREAMCPVKNTEINGYVVFTRFTIEPHTKHWHPFTLFETLVLTQDPDEQARPWTGREVRSVTEAEAIEAHDSIVQQIEETAQLDGEIQAAWIDLREKVFQITGSYPTIIF